MVGAVDGGSGRNQRRRAARHRQYTIQDFHREIAGVFSLVVVTPIEMLLLIDSNAALAAGLVDWLNQIEETRPICIGCETVFTPDLPPTAWLIAQAVHDDAKGVMLMGACEACCDRHPTADALIAVACDQLRRGAWPNLRALDPKHFGAGGRA
jgi:hypothetical protein